MTALTIEANRSATGGIVRRVPLAASANPFVGSFLSINSAGYANELVAGEPFLGICEKTIPTAQVGASAGDVRVECRSGTFVGIVTITGVAQDDVAHKRAVYASDDNAFTFTASGNTKVGVVIGVEATNTAIVLFTTADEIPGDLSGVKTLAATGNQTLTTGDLGKLILMPNTAALTVTLPAAADCAGGKLTFKKTSADAQAVTIDGNASETIDGSANFAACDAANDTVTIVCDGSAWYVVAKIIA
jgi:hypothetical protein